MSTTDHTPTPRAAGDVASLAERWERQSAEYLADWQDYDSHDGQERRGQGIALGDAASELRAALAAAPAPREQDQELYEQLAAVQHDIWAHWMRYLLGSKTYPITTEPTGRGIREADVQQWLRQIGTPYADLTEREKASDREQVDRFWPMLAGRSVSLDDAHTETVTEYRVMAGEHRIGTSGDLATARYIAEAPQFADRSDVRVELRTVTTSRRESEWKATNQ